MTASLQPTDLTAYLAPAGLLEPLLGELRNVQAVHERLVLAAGAPQSAHWAQNIWFDPVRISFSSIKEAAASLKQLQRNWWPYAYQLHRRTALIRAQLPHVAARSLDFPAASPASSLGSFTLLGPGELLAAARCASPFPNGEAQFKEFKIGPPSRAYLKLFEAFTRLGVYPGPGDRCLELGASPGGWTWVLARLGAAVVGYDRAPLDPEVGAMPGVSYVRGDAFQALPAKVGPIDWLCSDVICYPEKLLAFVRLWLAAGTCRNFICTLKFQGTEHYGVIAAFAAIPGSRIMHLHANKHELTWVLIRD